MAVSEEAVLKPTFKPKNPALINSDDWPTFSLREGKVVSQDNEEQVSLLSAHKHHPVKVTGYLLEIEDDLQHLVRDPNYRKRPIELTDVITYAFAEYLDGTYGFWAAGKAGWFEFDSFASSYKSIHNHMNEATSLVYVLADGLRQSNKKAVASLNGANFDRYMLRVYNQCISRAGNPTQFSDVEDVRDAFQEHRIFLITCMLEGQEGLDWLDTPLFAYFTRNFPEDVANLTARIVPVPIVPTTKIPLAAMEAMPPSKKRRSESPHITESKLKKKKNGKVLRKSPTPLPETPAPKIWKEFDASEEEYDDLDVITRKRKSILRPSGGKSSKKTKAPPVGQRSLAATDENNHSDDESRMEASRLAERSQITMITNAGHLDLITNQPKQPRDRDFQDRSSPSRFLPRKYLELSVAEYEIPSTEPQGPGGLWTCTFEGCQVRIHQAATASGQERVKDHLKTHIIRTKEKIDLVLDESRPYLPVNNLVRRLQAFAPPAGQDPAPGSIERTFSAPIRRKY